MLLKLATFACQGAQAGVSEGGDAHSKPPFAAGSDVHLESFFGSCINLGFFFLKELSGLLVCYLSYFVMPQEKKQTGPGKRNLFGRSKDSYITVFFVVPCDRKTPDPMGPVDPQDQPASPSSAATASPRSPKSGRYKDASAREKALARKTEFGFGCLRNVTRER